MNKSPKKFSLFQTHLILEIRPTFRLISYWTRLLWAALPVLLVSSLSYWVVERSFLRLRHSR